MDGALLAVAVLAASTSGPLIREAAAPALVIALWRNLLAAALTLPIALRQRTRLDRRERRLVLAAGVLLAGHFATWIWSLSFTTVASSVALVATQPVWAAVLARAAGHHVGSRTWTGIGLGLLGVLVVSGLDLSLSARALGGDALALAGGMFAAGYVSVGALARRTVSTTVYTTGCYAVASVVLLLGAAAGRLDVVHYDAATWWSLIAITLGPQLLGHSLVNRVLHFLSPTTVSVALLFEIVGATLLAWWWFGERPPGGTYPAVGLIAIGVVFVVTDRSGYAADVASSAGRTSSTSTTAP